MCKKKMVIHALDANGAIYIIIRELERKLWQSADEQQKKDFGAFALKTIFFINNYINKLL